MNNLDFFTEYEGQKKRAQKIFESLDKKIGSNKNELNEALFGLIKTAKDREKALKDYFFKITKAPNWQSYSVDLDSSGRQVKIENARPEDLEDAWEFIREQGVEDNFKGFLKQDGDSIIYQKKYPNSDSENQEDDLEGDEQNLTTTYKLIRAKNGIYYFGSTDRSALQIDNANSQIDTYDWENSPLKWLFEPSLSFELKSISFDFKKGKVINVDSVFWNGPFVGNTFKGVYSGESFKGNFFGSNENFKASPIAFVDGVFYDSTKKGLLGLDNVTEISENEDFNIIQVPAGYSIEILTNNQIRHTITVDKRLDERDSNFIYTLYLGYEIDYSDPLKRVVSWPQIRQEFDNYSINKDSVNIPNILSLQKNEKIIELKVLKAGTPPVFAQKEKFNPNKKQEDLIYGYKIEFNVNDESDFENLIKMKGYANSYQFTSDLKEISQLIEDGVIDSNYINKNFPYLKNILNDLFSKVNLKEVDLRGSKKAGSTRYNDFNKSGEFINPFTGRRIKTKADIQEFLHNKYKDYYSRYGEYPKEYEAEYNYYYNNIIRRNKINSNYGSNVESTSLKKGDKSLKRLENFIIYFVNKIDLGEKTNSMKSFMINNVIKKNIQKYMSVPNKVETPNQPITKAKAQKSKPSNPKGPIKLKEESVRIIIRDIINRIL